MRKRTGLHSGVLALLVLVMGLCLEPRARAAEEAAEEPQEEQEAGPEHEQEKEHEHRVHIGITAAALSSFANPIEGLYGGGAFLTVIAIPEWLEVELVVRAFKSPDATELPIDLLLKKPFHVNHWLHPFLGLGPTVVPSIGADGVQVHYGAAAAVGADLWLNSRLAVVVEFNENLVYEAEGLVAEIGGGAGVLIGF